MCRDVRLCAGDFTGRLKTLRLLLRLLKPALGRQGRCQLGVPGDLPEQHQQRRVRLSQLHQAPWQVLMLIQAGDLQIIEKHLPVSDVVLMVEREDLPFDRGRCQHVRAPHHASLLHQRGRQQGLEQGFKAPITLQGVQARHTFNQAFTTAPGKQQHAFRPQHRGNTELGQALLLHAFKQLLVQALGQRLCCQAVTGLLDQATVQRLRAGLGQQCQQTLHMPVQPQALRFNRATRGPHVPIAHGPGIHARLAAEHQIQRQVVAQHLVTGDCPGLQAALQALHHVNQQHLLQFTGIQLPGQQT